jgi:arginase
MPASFVIKETARYNGQLPGFEWVTPRLTARDVVFIGLRQVDPMERLILQQIGIKAYSMQEIDRLGMKEVVGRALEYINPRGDRPLHVSFDIDVLDRLVAPSTGTPSAGGLSLREALYLAEEIYETGQLTALDLVEVNPDLGSESDVSNTLEAAKQILLAFFGSCRGGDLPLDVKTIPDPENRDTVKQ